MFVVGGQKGREVGGVVLRKEGGKVLREECYWRKGG